MAGRASCEDCRIAYAATPWDTDDVRQLKAGGPPCKMCCPPVLPDNRDALEIYDRCAGQWIMGMGGEVDLNVVAVIEVTRELGWKRQRRAETLEKVQRIGWEVARLRRQEQAEKDSKE